MIIIVGGGIAGLSLAWQLVKQGAPVTLLEANEIGSGASYAAASYLEPRLGTGRMRELEWASVRAWPEFAAELESVSGLGLDYRRDGQLRIAYEENFEKIRADADQRVHEGWQVNWLEGRELRALEPQLSSEVVAGCYLPDVHWLDGRRLCRALAEAIKRSGGIIRTHTPVETLVSNTGSVCGVKVAGETIAAEKVVVAAGMGSNDIAGTPDDLPRCRPVKGVMLGLAMNKDAPIVGRLIKRPDGILCPRSDGRLLVGVTHEEGETSNIASAEAIQSLMASAVRAVPGIAKLEFIEAACGIRSFIGDGLLRLGRSSALGGLYYSLSHAGAGFIRAPAVSMAFSCFVLSEDADCAIIDAFLKR